MREVKGFGKKSIERVKRYIQQQEGDSYISKHSKDIHLGKNKIHLGDCLELMNGIPDRSVDMILCDLPYGTTSCSWDSVVDVQKLWMQYDRIIKSNGAVVLFGQEPFATHLRQSNIDNYKYEWVWEKQQGTNPFLVEYQPLKKTEYIMVFNKHSYYPQMEKGAPYSGFKDKTKTANRAIGSYSVHRDNPTGERYPTNLLRFNTERGKGHPTQKPVALLEYLIKTYTKKDEIVLDNCIGSGSTAIASINTGREYIGIELDEEYYQMARRRVEEHSIT